MRNPDPTKYSSAVYAKLMFVLETLRDADEETIHKVYVALVGKPQKEMDPSWVKTDQKAAP